MPRRRSSKKVHPKYRNIDGVVNKGRKKISMVQLLLDISKNHTRTKGKDMTHVNKLVAYILQHGIDDCIPCPIVEEISDGVFGVVDGNHRVDAYISLGHTEIEVDVYEFEDKWARKSVQQLANNHPPQLDADLESLVSTITDEINEGLPLDHPSGSGKGGVVILENDDDAIMDRIGVLADGKDLPYRKNALAEVVKRSGSVVRWMNYSDKDATRFLKKQNLSTGFLWNPITERYGAVCTAASEWRTICRALSLYNQTAPNGKRGVQTDLVIKIHKKGDLDTMLKRYRVINEIKAVEQDILDAAGSTSWAHGHPPTRIVGALPQDMGSTYKESMDNGVILYDPTTQKFI